MKKCTQCKIEKDNTCFSKNRAQCKDCKNGLAKQYYYDNKETIKEKKKRYWIDNKESLTAYSKQYHIDNKEELKAASREYWNKNRERKREIQNKWQKNKRATS